MLRHMGEQHKNGDESTSVHGGGGKIRMVVTPPLPTQATKWHYREPSVLRHEGTMDR